MKLCIDSLLSGSVTCLISAVVSGSLLGIIGAILFLTSVLIEIWPCIKLTNGIKQEELDSYIERLVNKKSVSVKSFWVNY